MLEIVLPIHKYILEFQSAMDDVLIVEMINSFDDLINPICSVALCKVNPSLLENL